jgi:hypothetical protein
MSRVTGEEGGWSVENGDAMRAVAERPDDVDGGRCAAMRQATHRVAE